MLGQPLNIKAMMPKFMISKAAVEHYLMRSEIIIKKQCR